MNAVSSGSRSGLLAIFVLSGFAGLIYQSIWSRYLGLFLGHAAYAQALVLAIFMGGMAIGAAWVGRAGQNWSNLVRCYAIIEAVIGLLGLTFHLVFNSVVDFSYESIMPNLGNPMAVQLVRWLIAATLILPQTVLLGMTFPLMSAGLRRRFPGKDGQLLGGLYFTNSIGAAFGVLISVFFLLPHLGLPGTLAFAAVLNFVVAGLALRVARKPETSHMNELSVVNHEKASILAAPKEASNAAHLQKHSLMYVVLCATALSGAASFVYEIAWIRMLSMAVGSTMHAFELMLASFIAGIAIGGLWISRRADDTPFPLRLAGWMQIAMGAAALASLWLYSNSFEWVGWMLAGLANSDQGYQLFNVGTAFIAIIIMMPAAFFAGTTLPLFTVTLLRANKGEGSIGRVYAWNTLGSIVGVFAAIHWLIPSFSLKNALWCAAGIDLLVGVYLIYFSRPATEDVRPSRHIWWRNNRPWLCACGLALTCMTFASNVHFDALHLASGVFRYGQGALLNKDRKLDFYSDGKTASIAVVSNKKGMAMISTNGKPDASIMLNDGHPFTYDEPTMSLLAILPLSMLERPERVGVIGFGSGMTTHTLLGDPRLKQVDTIEIEPAMVEGAKIFGSRVQRAYTDPRSQIIIDDAKAVFSANRVKYDIIISEPSNPWVNGIGSLFSKEFYSFIPKHINQDGLFVQWLQIYEIDEQLVGSVLNALAPYFEDFGIWMSNSGDLIIVASPHGKLPKSQLERLFSESASLRTELARLGISHQEQLDFHKIADSSLLRGLAATYSELPVNSDFRPILELDAPRTRFRNITAEYLINLPIQSSLFLESLKVRQPLPSTIKPFEIPYFKANALQAHARLVADDLTGKNVGYKTQEWMSGRETDFSRQLKSVASMLCVPELKETQLAELSQRIRSVSDLTIPALPQNMLQNIWIQPKWIPCDNKKFHPEVVRVFNLLSATAKRDYDAMQYQGRDWLENPVKSMALRENFDNWALQAVLFSLAHQNRWADVISEERRLGHLVSSQGFHAVDRKILQKIAQQMTEKTR